MERVISGIRPTGNLHLGNYFGAVKSFIRMQDEYQCMFFIADWHSLTTHPTPENLRRSVKTILSEYLACGIDPAKAPIYVQSDVKPVLELISRVKVRGISHITGGGFYENIPRCIPQGLGAEIRRSDVRVLSIFGHIARTGGISERDMFNTFNMGVGMVVVVSPGEKDTSLGILKDCGVDAYELGRIIKSEEQVVLI